jgi:hypothetical protein
MNKIVEEEITNQQAPVRPRKADMTYTRIASTSNWFGTRGRSANRLIERLKNENVNIFNHRMRLP